MDCSIKLGRNPDCSGHSVGSISSVSNTTSSTADISITVPTTSLTTTTAITLTSSPKTCSYGWTEFQVGMEKRCLKYMGKKDADKAESTCKSENARLPLPRSDQENSDYSEDWV